MEENHSASYKVIGLQSLVLMMGPLPVSYYSSGPESYTVESVIMTEKTLMPEAETIASQSKTLLPLSLHTLLSA